MEQRMFFNTLFDVLVDLSARFGDVPRLLYTKKLTAGDLVQPSSLTDELFVLPLYQNALADGIIGRGGDERAAAAYLEGIQAAYLHYWDADAKGRRVENRSWRGKY
jgi:hypothetical protein